MIFQMGFSQPISTTQLVFSISQWRWTVWRGCFGLQISMLMGRRVAKRISPRRLLNLEYSSLVKPSELRLGGGCKDLVILPWKLGKQIQFDKHYCSNGLKPPTRRSWISDCGWRWFFPADSGNFLLKMKGHTLPETNIAPENGWLEDYFPFGMAF